MMNAVIYEDIGKRAGGDIYIGVCGPVRTGKSSFIKRFMDVMVLPNMTNQYEKTRVMDELPQSGEGKTITTTEPKFIPPEAAVIRTKNGAEFKVRIVDCVGYLVPGVLGNLEDGKERMVNTPWFNEQIPFSKAAEIGTEKVIKDHSVIGIVITSDGSFGDLPRHSFIDAERKTINQLKELHKPFVIVLNSATPQNIRTKELAESLENEYQIPVIATNCQRMNEDSFDELFEKLLYQFPAAEIHFKLPSFLESLENEHWIKETIISSVKNWMKDVDTLGDVIEKAVYVADGNVMKSAKAGEVDVSTGKVIIEPRVDDNLYYKVIEEFLGAPVANEGQLFMLLKEYAYGKRAYDNIKDAIDKVNNDEYGIVSPKLSDMTLAKPEVFKSGNKYGVKICATAPCLHIIKTNITTEISPVVGTESQSKELADMLASKFESEDEDIWETNLFGKTLKDMVIEQMTTKVSEIPQGVQKKVQKSLQKISDDGKDYFICIIL